MYTIIKSLVSVSLILTILSLNGNSTETTSQRSEFQQNITRKIRAIHEHTLGFAILYQIQDESESDTPNNFDFSIYQECFYHFKSAFRYGSYDSCPYLATLHEIAANKQFQLEENVTLSPLEHFRAAKTHYNLAVIFKTANIADVQDSLKRINLQIKDMTKPEERIKISNRWL